MKKQKLIFCLKKRKAEIIHFLKKPFLIPILLLFEVYCFVSAVLLKVPMCHLPLFEIESSGEKKRKVNIQLDSEMKNFHH